MIPVFLEVTDAEAKRTTLVNLMHVIGIDRGPNDGARLHMRDRFSIDVVESYDTVRSALAGGGPLGATGQVLRSAPIV